MIVIRCTAKLLAKLEPCEPARASTTRLGDWYATLVRTRRGHFVLAMARNTLLPVVVAARDLRRFPERLRERAGEVLAYYGVPAAAIERELEGMREVAFTRTDDRSNVAVLREFQRLFEHHLAYEPELPLLDHCLRLAPTPIIARNTFPDHATCKLFGVGGPPSAFDFDLEPLLN